MTTKDIAKELSVLPVNRSYEYRGVTIYKDTTDRVVSGPNGERRITVARYTAYFANKRIEEGTSTSIVREVDRILRSYE